MKRMGALFAAVALAALAAPALANDSTAELAAGGLVLRQTSDIEMRSEDLYISTRAVRVTYHFRNTSARPVTTVVAFPMPDITIEGPDDNISIPHPDAANFLNFATTVDGRPVATRLELRVIARGVDQTAYLRGLGIPLSPARQATGRALDRLPAATRAEIVRRGLGFEEDYDMGHGMERHLSATWTLKTTYYWTQTFQPGRDTVISHRYEPAVGQSVASSLSLPDYANSDDGRTDRATYCVDDAFMAALRAAPRMPDSEMANLTESRVRYVLTTGANWARPIGDFRMVIDKLSPSNLVSFCGTGVRRISPTQFEVRYRNFTPRQDVAVLVLTPIRN